MKTLLIIIGIGWVVIIAFVWMRGGLHKGRKFGNEIADHLGWSHNFFHSVLDNGVGPLGPSLQLLATLKTMNLTAATASVHVARHLRDGLNNLEARFGPQQMISDVRVQVDALLVEREKSDSSL
jgi:hypothetical protein